MQVSIMGEANMFNDVHAYYGVTNRLIAGYKIMHIIVA